MSAVLQKLLALAIQYGVPALYTVGAAALSLGFRKLYAFIDAKLGTTRTGAALQKLLHVVETVVTQLEATEKPVLLAASADGKLSDEAKVQLRAKALEAIKVYLGPDGLSSLETDLGIEPGVVNDYLIALIEKAVWGIK